MSNHYHDENDLKLLKEMKQAAPEEFKAWANLDGIVGRDDGAIPRKYRELIAIAVAHTTQCVYCIEVHAKNAKKAGATKQEVAEAVFLAAALRAGGAAAHGTLAMKFFDQTAG
jgi:AhpD family alkylhydroperoxidase